MLNAIKDWIKGHRKDHIIRKRNGNFKMVTKKRYDFLTKDLPVKEPETYKFSNYDITIGDDFIHFNDAALKMPFPRIKSKG